MSPFAGKVVLVTGSSSGIGRVTARLLARHGAFGVTVTGRNKDALEVTKREILVENSSTQVLPMLGDITNRDFQKTLVDETVSNFKKLDILINNAGAAGKNPVTSPEGQGLEQSLEHFDFNLNVNTKSVLSLTQLAVPHLEKTQGEIVNVSSVVSQHFGHIGMPYYAAAKAALDHLTRSMALAYISRGIRVNGVNPGIIKTDFFSNVGVPKDKTDSVGDSFYIHRVLVLCQALYGS